MGGADDAGGFPGEVRVQDQQASLAGRVSEAAQLPEQRFDRRLNANFISCHLFASVLTLIATS